MCDLCSRQASVTKGILCLQDSSAASQCLREGQVTAAPRLWFDERARGNHPISSIMGSRGFCFHLTHAPVTARLWLCNNFTTLCCLSGVARPAWAVPQLQHSRLETRCQPGPCFKASQVCLSPWSVRGLCQGTVTAGWDVTPEGAAPCWKSQASLPFPHASFHFGHRWLWSQGNAAGPSCSAVSLCGRSWTIAYWC